MIFAHRRDFLKQSAACWPWELNPPRGEQAQPARQSEAGEAFSTFQARRRQELWSLLGDLQWAHKPGPAKLVKTEKHDGYTLERLVLDLNGIEPGPALLFIPDKRQKPAPGLLFIHWHGGMYDLGKGTTAGMEQKPSLPMRRSVRKRHCDAGH